MQVKFYSEAEAELTEAALFYEDKVIGLGNYSENSSSNDFLIQSFTCMTNKVFSYWQLPITNDALAIGNFDKVPVKLSANLNCLRS